MKQLGAWCAIGGLLYCCAAGLFVTWIGQGAALDYLPRPLVELGFFGFIGFGLLSWPTLGFGLLAAVMWRGKRKVGLALACGALLVMASSGPVTRLAMRLRQAWLERVVAEAEPLVRGLSAMEATQAEGLAASFRSPSLRGRRFAYRRSGDGWELSLPPPPILFGTTDRFFYRSDQRYPEIERLADGRVDGRYERVGSWAYFHDNDE
jgi:hypothetical protein